MGTRFASRLPCGADVIENMRRLHRLHEGLTPSLYTNRKTEKVSTMALLVNKTQYIRRMNSALKHKKAILPHVVGPKVLDFGCGTGALTDLLREKAPYVMGYDESFDMIEVARNYSPHTSFTFVRPTEKFNTIVLSGVLHEVYSYQGEKAVRELIESLVDQLLPFCRLVIREATYRPLGFLHVPVKDNLHAKTFYDKYSEQYKWEVPDLALTASGYVLRGREQHVLEFLNTYTWGDASFPREVEERVYFHSIADWKCLADELKLSCDYFFVRQKDYYKHLSKLVDVSNIKHLNTHAIVVLERGV